MVLMPVIQETFVFYARYFLFYIFFRYDVSFDLTKIMALYILTVTYPVVILSEQMTKKKRKKKFLELLKKQLEEGILDFEEFFYRIEKSGAPRFIERVLRVLREARKPLYIDEIIDHLSIISLKPPMRSRVMGMLSSLFLLGFICKLDNEVDVRLRWYISKGNPNCPLKIRNKCNKCSSSGEKLLWT